MTSESIWEKESELQLDTASATLLLFEKIDNLSNFIFKTDN